MMAHAYARVTGKPGICIAPMGPGVANLVTGLANAWADASPVIAIGGSCADARDHAGYLPGDGPGSDDEADREGAYRVDLGYRIPEYISIAFREALDGKRGPIYLDLPGDILSGKVDEEKIHWVEGNYRTDARPAGDPALIAQARSNCWRKRASLSIAHRQRRALVGCRRDLAEVRRGHRYPILTRRRRAAA